MTQCTFIPRSGRNKNNRCNSEISVGTFCRRHYTYLERRRQRGQSATQLRPSPPLSNIENIVTAFI